MAKKKMTYESAVEELEIIINDLSEGNIPLKDVVKNYTKGMELLVFCNNELTQAESELKKVVKLENGKVVEENLVLEGE